MSNSLMVGQFLFPNFISFMLDTENIKRTQFKFILRSPLSFRKEMIDEVQQVVKRYMQDQHSMALFPSTSSIHPDRTL